MKYRYELPQGAYVGQYETTFLWEDCDRVWVVYDPDQPERSVPTS